MNIAFVSFLHMTQMCKEKSNQLTPVVVCGVV